ncbi:hypothetical protein [Mycobacterium sp. SMC-4]|uniref:hypothetical protein n=1 Tax=Mycobacterium sp. SMC-4 TaxID=2857059 RepID=UPI0021B1BC4A|nr:hypothetical protein [Mycobacterium sp. SMC-4]UXA19377.1 hypothetical protein KXD98_07140 [Mycobacterium sp. SMC-4]
METLIPATVRQARWLLVGGAFMAVLGLLRVVGFVNHGGIVYLGMGALFLTLAVLSVYAGVTRIRRGEENRSQRG